MSKHDIPPHILIVDDDVEITDLLSTYLSQSGFQVSTAHNGEEMNGILHRHSINLIVLDVMMPGDDGFSLCKSLRIKSNIPVIMLTASSEETDRIIGLELGADDYMNKPFNPRELLARIKAVLRRTDDKDSDIPKSQRVRFSDWTLDLLQRKLINTSGEECALSGADFDLLHLFIQQPAKVISREDLFKQIKGRDLNPYDRSIDVQISRLRQKLELSTEHKQLIKTVRGQGYVLIADVEYI